MMATWPASVTPPGSSRGTPTARSANPSPSKSPAASDLPNSASWRSVPPIPSLSIVQNWLPVAEIPAADPYRTFTPPASSSFESSRGTPTARSAKPSPSKSPAATANPNSSSTSAVPWISALSWVQTWFPFEVRPLADP